MLKEADFSSQPPIDITITWLLEQHFDHLPTITPKSQISSHHDFR
jgi:hypothetical protein